jgi:Ion channel
LSGSQPAADNGRPKPIVQLDVHRLRRVVIDQDWREEAGTDVFHPEGELVMSILHGTFFLSSQFGGWEIVPVLVVVLVLGLFPGGVLHVRYGNGASGYRFARLARFQGADERSFSRTGRRRVRGRLSCPPTLKATSAPGRLQKLTKMRKPSPISVRFGKSEFLKINADRFDWRDTYHWVLSLTWPQFAGLVFGIYMIVNVIFAVLYVLGGKGIAEMHPGSFLDGFFFSVETFAAVSYGHMYPDSLYGHSIATLEIMVGMFGMAVITGLVFIRFSRPMAKILFSKVAYVGLFDGYQNLMIRVANLRHQRWLKPSFV